MVLNTVMMRLDQKRSAAQARWDARERPVIEGCKIP